MNNTIQYLSWLVVLFVLMFTSICDIRCRRIPNLITLPAIVTGLILTGINKPGTLTWVFIFLFALFLIGMLPIMSPGDIKLVMVIVSFCGIYTAVIITGIAEFVVLAVQLIRHPKETMHDIRVSMRAIFTLNFKYIDPKGRRVPFALYLLCGFLVYTVFISISAG